MNQAFTLLSTKTFWTGVAGVATICASIVGGELTVAQGIMGIFPLVQAMFIRQSIGVK